MIFNLEGLTVYFPYEYVYPEQYKYMLELKHGLDAKGHGCLEMPTGTGKTITCLALITSYQRAHPECGKLIYCTRTVPEMEKVLGELPCCSVPREARRQGFGNHGRRPEQPQEHVHPPQGRGRGLERERDARCRRLTASWVREKHIDAASREEETSTELCQFFEDYEKEGPDAVLPPGVYTLADLREFGRKKGWCPYFLARHMIGVANVVVYNYQYLLDPKVSSLVSRELEKECVVVFDEAHNIDNVCIEALSVNLRQQTLDAAGRNITSLSGKIERAKQTDARKLREEYARLVDGLAQQGVLRRGGGEDALQNPVIPDDILREAVPGNIRRAEHFVAFLRRFVEYLKTRMRATQVEQETHGVPRALTAERGD